MALFIAGIFLHIETAGAITFQIERLSDTQAVVTGTGTMGSISSSINNQHIITFGTGLFGVDPTSMYSSILTSSTMQIGGKSVDFAYDVNCCSVMFVPSLYFGSLSGIFETGDSVIGSLTMTLVDSNTWASIGTTGTAYSGLVDPAATGTWEIVAGPSTVPIPPALSLFGSGLALMGFIGWRRKRKAAAA